MRCDLASVRAEHLRGAEAVVHCAAFAEAWGPRDAWFKGNVLGPQAALDGAREAGVRRFVHIGTEAALIDGQALRGVDESYPLAPHSSDPYCATKAQAEQRVRAANGERAWRLLEVSGAPPLTRKVALAMTRDRVLKGDKAKAELGYEPVITVAQGMAALARG